MESSGYEGSSGQAAGLSGKRMPSTISNDLVPDRCGPRMLPLGQFDMAPDWIAAGGGGKPGDAAESRKQAPW